MFISIVVLIPRYVEVTPLLVESNLREDVRLSIKLIVVFDVVSISVGKVNLPIKLVSADTSKVPCISILLLKIV